MSVILAADYVTLTDGATVATDASLAETFFLLMGRAARTMSNPTNPTTGQTISYLTENLWGTTTTSWGTSFVLAGTFTEPSVDRARSISFIYTGGLWVETGRSGDDLKLRPTPDDIASLVAWYDATTLDLADTNAVPSWEARYGPELVQATGSKQPLFRTAIQNGRPIVRFDGTDDYLHVANPLLNDTNCSACAVFAKGEIASTSFRTLADISGTGGYGCVFWENLSTTANRVGVTYGSSGGGSTSNIAMTAIGTAFHQFSLTLPNAGTPKIYKDQGGATTGTTASTNFTQVSLYVGANGGNQRYMNGDLAELLLFSTALSDPDRAIVETYLKTKWGTP